MRKSKLKSGEPFYGIKIDMFVTANCFAHALADYCWTKSIDFDTNMKKSEAITILKNGLFYNGISGEFDGSLFEGASQEAFDAWDIPFKAAHNWVIKNYPYLNSKEVTNG